MTDSTVVQSPLDRAKGHEVIWSQVQDIFPLACRVLENPRFVYFIGEEDGPLKIGVAENPVHRLRGMQIGNPRRLRVEYALVGDGPTERLLHDLWRPFHLVAEWFRPEIRPELFPIVDTAITNQIMRLIEASDNGMIDMEAPIRDARKEHDFVAQGRDQVRLLARTAGYVVYNRR